MNLKLFETDLIISNKFGLTRFEELNIPSPPTSHITDDDHCSLTQLSLSKSCLQDDHKHRVSSKEQQCPDDQPNKSKKIMAYFDLDGVVNKEKNRGKNGIHTKVCSRGHWRPAEDAKLRELVAQFGPQNWNLIAQHLASRSGKSCRLRWFNQLDPRINKRAFTEEEGERLLAAHRAYGNKWAVIARLFPGRTDNAVKNHWHVIMARRTREQQQQQQQQQQNSSARAKMTLLPCQPSSDVDVGGFMRSSHVILLQQQQQQQLEDEDEDEDGNDDNKNSSKIERISKMNNNIHGHGDESTMTTSNDESAASTCTTDLSLFWFSNTTLNPGGDDQSGQKAKARTENESFGNVLDHLNRRKNGQSDSLNSEISGDNSLATPTFIEMKMKQKKKKKIGSHFFDFLGVGAS